MHMTYGENVKYLSDKLLHFICRKLSALNLVANEQFQSGSSLTSIYLKPDTDYFEAIKIRQITISVMQLFSLCYSLHLKMTPRMLH